jgi:hypothetical protein
VSMSYISQPEQQQQLEWLDGGTLAMLLDGASTNGQLMVGRFDVSSAHPAFTSRPTPRSQRTTATSSSARHVD